MSVDLSIIIVNYNVRYFLENCLRSVQKAAVGIDVEVIIVDNASKDDSARMVEELFPSVQYIYLDENVGFSRGNNIGIAQSSGEYILLLNPDTVLQENTLTTCLHYLKSKPKGGGLGVHMTDGHGNFLPESKRGLPTPAAAFYKISGLARIFPKSRTFGKYHAGYLNEFENYEVDILSGAFMMMPRKVFDEVGGLDEDYFMYGEDIDLSYKIIKAGYKNYYFSESSIIHYKGESTKKGSINYVFVFYNAMVIFARKHFEKDRASLFSIMINGAIYLRAAFALLRRLLGRYWRILIDFVIFYSSFIVGTSFYESFGEKDFSLPFVDLLLPLYAMVIALTMEAAGSNDNPWKLMNLLKGWLGGSIVLLAIYALLPEMYRFSRAVLIIGSMGGLLASILWRVLLLPNSKSFPKRRLLIGDVKSIDALTALLKKTHIANDFLARVRLDDDAESSSALTSIDSLDLAISEYRIEEVVVDASVNTYANTLKIISDLRESEVGVKLLNGNWMIGPNEVIKEHKWAAGNALYHMNYSKIQRIKRISDFVISILIVLFLPLFFVLADNKIGFFKNVISVLVGRKSWVGYDARGLDSSLPKLKQGVVHPGQDKIWPKDEDQMAFGLNVQYLHRLALVSDFQIVIRNIYNLG